MTQAERDINRKVKVLNYAKVNGNVSKACRIVCSSFASRRE